METAGKDSVWSNNEPSEERLLNILAGDSAPIWCFFLASPPASISPTSVAADSRLWRVLYRVSETTTPRTTASTTKAPIWDQDLFSTLF